ncbi:MAG: DNA-processing protein DprA [Steroidobacteraceae bacterium]
MEPARLRAMLARTPGLLARHLTACPEFTAEQPQRLLAGALPAAARAWLAQPDNHLIDSDLRWAQAHGVQILSCLDADFPATLAHLPWTPAALYLIGNPRLLGGLLLAIVGSRQSSIAGRDTARRFAAELAAAGLGILSGLDEGIGAAALDSALAAGSGPIGVCAAGLDRIYPRQSAPLAARIRAQGCLISPFAPGSPPRRHHFPLRDRMLCSLGTGTLVIEALGGSALGVAAGQALQRQRRVFAIPGCIRDPLARGCNQLIRAGATLVQDPCEILQDLGISDAHQRVIAPRKPRTSPRSAAPPLDNKYEMLLDAAGFEPVDIDVLAFRTGWSGHTVASMLLLLELQGRIAPQPGGRYCRLS